MPIPVLPNGSEIVYVNVSSPTCPVVGAYTICVVVLDTEPLLPWVNELILRVSPSGSESLLSSVEISIDFDSFLFTLVIVSFAATGSLLVSVNPNAPICASAAW